MQGVHCGHKITGPHLKNIVALCVCAIGLCRGVVEKTATPSRPIEIGVEQCDGEDICNVLPNLFININQLDALNFIISIFQASTCFEHM